ncbi:MAG: TetR/AcrR family transcriptional regulator [bacterium]
MNARDGQGARGKLIRAGTELFRRQGYSATSVDSIVEAAGVSKGSFFYHFENKEELAVACLAGWDEMVRNTMQGAPFMQTEDPVQRLQGCLDFFIAMFSDPTAYPSCLVGTTVQEVAESNPTLRDAAQQCFVHAVEDLGGLIELAGRARGRELDGQALAGLWMATLQGSLLMAKASGDLSRIPANLRSQREYILGLLV